MAELAEQEQEELTLDDAPEEQAEQQGSEEKAAEDVGEKSEGEAAEADEGELTVQIGDAEPEESDRAPDWVRELRKANREKDKKIAELEAQVGGRQQIEVGPEPTMADVDYDEDEFKRRWNEWNDTKRAKEAEQAAVEETQRKADEKWQKRLQFYDEAKAKLNAPDFEDAEETAREVLARPFPGLQVADIRTNIIKQGAKDPALFMLAIGKNRKAAEELAKIDDPVEYAFAAGRLEAQMKVSRKPKTQPEGESPSKTGTGATSADNHLEKLREEAMKTGDFSKVAAYKREQKRKAA